MSELKPRRKKRLTKKPTETTAILKALGDLATAMSAVKKLVTPVVKTYLGKIRSRKKKTNEH